MKKRNWIRHRPLFAPQTPVKPQRWYQRILPFLWRGIHRACYTIGAMVLISAVFMFISLMNLGGGSSRPAALPKEMVLYLPLEGDPGERDAMPSPFLAPQATIHDLVHAVDRAASDKRVKGIFARMDEGTFSLARSEELRAAIKRFRAAGKFAYIYSSSYGQGAGDLGRYYLASAFDEIWMQPMGIVSIGGIRAEVPYLRKTLDKIGITPQFFQRKEYKTAYESFTNSEMSDKNREEIKAILDDMKAVIMKDVPGDRGIDAKIFGALVDEGLFTAPEAQDAKLITQADYADVLIEKIKTQVKGDPEADDDFFIDIMDYESTNVWEESEKRMVSKAFTGARPSVAMIYVVGAIMDTNAGNSAEIAAADEIAPAILDAADDESIQAIILRIDSPGGSPVASESILRAVERAKRKGKPVIVSMGATAASGGYWVAAYADQIFAMSSTLTGSIGVLGGKVSAGKLSEKLGVNWDRSVQWGKNSGMWSLTTPFSESEAERMNAMLDHVYASFIERVSRGRGMTPEQVDKIAGGRVWSGAAAAKIGLIDQIGGLREAMNYTAKILGAEDRNGIDVIVLPAPKGALERLIELLDSQATIFAGWQFQQKIAAFFAPLMEAVSVMQGSNGAMAYEPLKIE